MTRTDAVLLLPPEPGRLTTMEGVKTVPWQPDGVGFTVSDLNDRLRAKQPVVGWLRQFDLELDVIETNEAGTWFHLTSIEGSRI